MAPSVSFGVVPVPVPSPCLGAHDGLPSHWWVRSLSACPQGELVTQNMLSELGWAPWFGIFSPQGLPETWCLAAPKLSFFPSIEIGNCIAVQVCMLQIPILVLFTIFYVSSPRTALRDLLQQGWGHGGPWKGHSCPSQCLPSAQCGGSGVRCLLVLSPPWGCVAERV